MNGNTVKFKKYRCLVEIRKYNNDRTALELTDLKNGEPVLVASLNIPSEKLAANEVIIKNYFENEGVLEILVKAGIVSPPTRFVHGNEGMPICKLLI